MGTELISKDYITLLKEDIPKGRDDLINTSKTLEEVAEHCLNSYDKSLEQTVNYTAQALGSVAYKINLLATNFLEVLDQQNIKLNSLQTKVNHLNMQVQIHQEKTARLSIGKYTLPRDPNAMRPSKNPEPITEITGKYKRREIDFSALDNIGHGVKEPQLGGSSAIYSGTSRRSSTSGSDTHSSNYGYSQSNPGGSLGPKAGVEYLSKYSGKLQTIGRASGLTLNTSSGIYKAPGTLTKSQIPMNSPVVNLGNGAANPVAGVQQSNYGNTIHYQQQMSLGRSSSSSGASSVVSGSQIQQQQQKQYQVPANVVSPQKLQQQPTQYGYPGIPPPPPPPNIAPTVASVGQQDPNAAMVRYSDLPPPPMVSHSPYQQQNITVLPPPPIEQIQQRQISSEQQQQINSSRYSTDPVSIVHLQPTPYDVFRNKVVNDPVWAPSQYICKVITMYEYQQNKDDELSFNEKEIIYVIKKNNDGWWEGIMADRTGLFPGNYVQIIN